MIHLMVKDIVDFAHQLICLPYLTYFRASQVPLPFPQNLPLKCPFALRSSAIPPSCYTIGPISLCPRLDFAQAPLSSCCVSPLCEYDRSPVHSSSLSVFRRPMRHMLTSFRPVFAVKYGTFSASADALAFPVYVSCSLTTSLRFLPSLHLLALVINDK